MTGFASERGAHAGYAWVWELRSVNGKGLDLRLRVPDWIEGLEAGLRARLTKALARGNVSLGLRVQAEEQGGRLRVNTAQLDDVLAAMAEVEARAMAQGLSLAPARPGDVLSVRGVLETASAEQDTAELSKALMADFDAVLAAFQAMRAAEGKALHGVLEAQLDEVSRLTDEAALAAEARRDDMAAALRASLARVLDNADGVDEARLTQELAMIAVKSDVTEEIDRLRTHVTAARDLLAQDGAVGRKLDFLMQEFNREANTLCSKAQSSGLTSIGLALKAVIDQMREQVQNVE
ncbi:YicC/YloC family endoribonuclease [Roseovarius sp. ZX-A-9]|uniref:YicC/YloC family endoribonuclease n=1 Tax=Roseovarius sp. ZX-A-9 TaxID=3014783 RepID=UPI00232FEE4D|nr:YicC/YloC family endoribonuclease [Roseovarius sp. ZX-A-9]